MKDNEFNKTVKGIREVANKCLIGGTPSKDMNLEFFPHFIRSIYPNIDIKNKQIAIIGKEFKTYLENKFKDDKSKLEFIWNIEPLNVILNENHPFRMKGYHPALVLHFTNFIEEVKNKLCK